MALQCTKSAGHWKVGGTGPGWEDAGHAPLPGTPHSQPTEPHLSWERVLNAHLTGDTPEAQRGDLPKVTHRAWT